MALAFFAAIALNGCSPYEEGPGISFRSKSERIANTWVINYAVEADGDVVLDDYNNGTYSLTKDGQVTIDDELGGIPFTATGTWTLMSDDENINVKSEADFGLITLESDETYEILKLKENEMWIKDVDDDGTELHFIPK